MLTKITGNIDIIGSLLLGSISFLLGGWDLLLKIILLLIIFDVVTGMLKAIWCKSLSSRYGFKGIIKKIIILIIIAVSNLLQTLLNDSIPIRETVLMFYIINESISIVENAAYFIPIPKKLRDILVQLKEKQTDDNNKKGDVNYGR
jgi:toxin secretion/phage lysis holin